MERRDFLKVCSAAMVGAMGSQLGLRSAQLQRTPEVYEELGVSAFDMADAIQHIASVCHRPGELQPSFRKDRSASESSQGNLQSYMAKMKSFEQTHEDDVFLDASQYRILLSTFKRLESVQDLVGHGNFNVIGFDEMIRFSRRYSSVGEFSVKELEFIDQIFFGDAQNYGFFGEKVTSELTAAVPPKSRFWVPNTGHFIYRGDSLNSYARVRKDVGDSLILTSGIRSVVKQTYLFLAKSIQSRGNLSRASRSLAPPGYSFHGVGDYDVGKIGFGRRNFTRDFTTTGEFRKLLDLGYVNIRYPEDNLLGLRYEPWHIKVV